MAEGRSAASRRVGLWPAYGVAAASLLVAGFFLVPTLVPAGPPSLTGAGFGIAAAIPPWNNWTCNPNNPSPAALAIPVSNPGHGEAAGSKLIVVYEFEVVGYTTKDKGLVVLLPTAKAVFPTKGGTPYEVQISPKNLKITGSGWTNPALLTTSVTLTANLTFSGAKAYLTTTKEAVMVNVSSGSLTLEFRWHWSFKPAAGGPLRTGAWSIPSSTAASPFLPSIFYPAPFVGLVSNSTSPASSGSTYDLTLNGTVRWTSFRIVLEYPNNGTEIQSIWENSSSAALYTATVPLAYRNGNPLPAGSYLVHVHDVCEAIVHMTSVVAT